MWSFIVTIGLDSDPFILEECPNILPVKQDCLFYSWSPLNINIDGFDSKKDKLVLSFLLQCNNGRILIKKKEIVLGKLNYSPLTHKNHVLSQNNLQLQYKAFKYDDNNERLGQLKITNISLSGFNLVDYIKDNDEGHKITCMINGIYFSRAQSCDTNINSKVREYRWLSLPSKPLSDDFNEYEYDLKLIKIANPSGFDTRNKTGVEYVPFFPDIDTFTNYDSKLPLIIENNQRIHFRLFNFKFTPPKCVETIFHYKEFIPSQPLPVLQPKPVSILGLLRRNIHHDTKDEPRTIGMVNRKLIHGLYVNIMFIKNDLSVRITSVCVKANDYENTLCMNEIQKQITF